MKFLEDIDTLLAQFAEADQKKLQVVVELCKAPPSKRSAFSFTMHPEKDQLFMLAGEYFNGINTMVHNELYSYTVKQDRWHDIRCPGGPPPRCAHQTVAVQQNGGELWVFGGEFTSKSQSQFYHYKDLWVYSIANKTWRKITAKDGPSARSGHRMVLSQKKLFLFGGFHDNGFDYKYFNDVHAFDLENYQWLKLEISGKLPDARSACGMAALNDGRLLVYGGYSRQKLQGAKDDSGVIHTDMFHLVPNKHDTTGLQYKWVLVKQSGDVPNPPRCSFSFSACCSLGQAGTWQDKAVLFGGVNDIQPPDEDEKLEGEFFNDLFLLDMTRGSWVELQLSGKRSAADEEKKRRRAEEDKDDVEMPDVQEADDAAAELTKASLEPQVHTVVTDGIFTLTVDMRSSTSAAASNELGSSLVARAADKNVFWPPPRISGGLSVRSGVLYLYGGLYEEGDKQLTLNDFYSLDLNKLEEWRVIKPLDPKDLEWFDSEDDEDDDDDDDSDSEDGSEDDH
ncbi:hypothetical protein HAZT_HAZT005788 [Hyalella azteca]|uniref:Kelch domain-containing protein 4 n=1 Tax=Hyalella azteca TaxID=294128 RepID=A0A6A0H3C0_HYAAZ|nr:hypothetical protein HAZT_HAZT005788 [Hyalella azteca]